MLRFYHPLTATARRIKPLHVYACIDFRATNQLHTYVFFNVLYDLLQAHTG